MPSSKDIKPYQRSVPTRSSLDLAEQVAKLAGLPFDRDAVSDESLILHELIFSDLCAVTGRRAEDFNFQSGRYFSARVFSALRTDGAVSIGLDLIFDYWLSSLSHIGAIAAFDTPNETLWSTMLTQTDRLMGLFLDAKIFEDIREGMAPLLMTHAHLLNISEGVARAMLIFTLCHEIAHAEADHLNQAHDMQQELDADIAAAKIFADLVMAGDQAYDTRVYIDPKIASAPLVLSEFLGLLEAWLEKKGMGSGVSRTHPLSDQRAAAVREILNPVLSETAALVLSGYQAGLEDIKLAISGA